MGHWQNLAWLFAVLIVAAYVAVELAWLLEYAQRMPGS
jgi:hypothetical protein